MIVIQKLVPLTKSHSKNRLTQNNNTLKEEEEEKHLQREYPAN